MLRTDRRFKNRILIHAKYTSFCIMHIRDDCPSYFSTLQNGIATIQTPYQKGKKIIKKDLNGNPSLFLIGDLSM